MKKSKPITVELVEFECDECSKGVYRVDQPQTPSNNQWRHTCTNCKKEAYFVYPFPYIVYKGEEFILRKHIPRQSPKPDL
ncbi:hypothetical protein [Vibrio sonorensis]|uniref:hypothetical protein n=1 Tax=Vibrio sonorensis TaxID=1004316 RepID=UPI0009FB9EA3|nr:hypothetical protein [Vibrio sonorensis]